MKILCLGGGGRICREAILDIVRFSDFSKITVADVDEAAAHEVVQWIGDLRMDNVRADADDTRQTVSLMKAYDIVMDGTPISLNDQSTRCIAEAGVHGINLNGMSHEWDFDEAFRERDKTCVPGFGMTPGITNMMAIHAANRLDTVESVRCSHGEFRPIAFSKGIAETTRIEYDPNLSSRVVFEDGELKQVSPFARPRDIALPPPYGTHPQYIIPHPEPLTLSKSLADKGVRLVEARGTWPPKNMRLLKALYEWGIMRNDTVRLNDCEVGVLDAVMAHCLQSREGTETELYGYALHVQVVGTKDGQRVEYILTHTHPPSDGTVDEWAGLRAYTRCVGIPLSIGAQLIAAGKARDVGTVAPELAFDPEDVFAELEKRDILIHVQTNAIYEDRESSAR